MPNEPHRLDDIDRHLVELLAQDSRMSNVALASAVGVAPSTCLTRLRALRRSGAIRGFRAEVDPAALGLPLQAMVSVRLSPHGRTQVDRFRQVAPRLPGVLSVYHVSGQDDYLLHVAVADPEALRNLLLDHIVALPEVAHAETSLIFEHLPGSWLGAAR